MKLPATRRDCISIPLFCMIVLMFVAPQIACGKFPSDSTPGKGLVEQHPADQPSIKTPAGYMVAYSDTIPGTSVAFEMVPIPGGKFLIGSAANEAERGEDEGPQVEIHLPPMWVAKHEVTWAEYRQYMELCNVFEKFDDAGIRQIMDTNEIDAITAPSKLYEPSFTFSVGEGPRHPAVSMSQYAAKQYTKWLSLLTGRFYRLPTEAEWEYACRAGTNTAYGFGDDPADLAAYAWYYDNADDETHPVGGKKPNAWGLHDMHGNASEWVLDAYDAQRYAQLATSQETISSEAAFFDNKTLFPRVLRGGSWNLDPPDCRSATRRQSNDDEWRSYDPNSPTSPWWFASDESQDVGFRIVRPLETPTRTVCENFWGTDIASVLRVVNKRIDEEGRGERGIVDDNLPAAIKSMESK